ncbi:hypothetical protein MPK66_gp224 [Erwinia phage pEa_SNUABM_2]|uniref:Uncharacterized protein n=1 Tax=Erwinia phage pEa_SNUABM_2 TaxID=2869547 RepID=A0AAE7XT49_9CAUD|nr:hypothetical protein MPK66_gp224 [Erwinia phage pEa_SNUABM_2]QZE59468.1 hypothetical protein pEaSNUABM2_00224 [Erwinia phage pEa_SNUABM_2]QZE59804.1 hypothetical protein pEaSNUABM39_00224 [Erwinia phage pEa_SNUABM_39]
MEQLDLLRVVNEIVSEFGRSHYLAQGSVGTNTEHYATYETLISVMADSTGSFHEADLRAKIAAQIDEYRVVGFTRTYNEQVKEFVLKLTDPVFTYRDPQECPANGKVLYSVSIGFPFVAAN